MEPVIFALLGVVVTLACLFGHRRFLSFLAQKPTDYAEATELFDIRSHLNGTLICEGVIYGPTGRVASRFVGHFDARWDGNDGVMSEHFIYDGGTTQDRAWHLKVLPDGNIEARAEDVVGVGSGQQQGSAVQLKYRIKLPEASGGHELDVVDWMYLAPNGSIVNRSQFRKFGIQVAELVATIRPVAAESEDREAA